MNMRLELGAALLGGAAAGVVGYAAFLAIHAIWIVPIWSDGPAASPLRFWSREVDGAKLVVLIRLKHDIVVARDAF